jgi:PAS domain S-box-containing protein
VRIEEVEQYRKDGSTVWIDMTTTFLLDQEGRPTGILGISHDITHRKIVERQLQEAREKLEERVRERTGELESANVKLRNEILERERTAEALRESEERFRAISDTAWDSIFIKDRELRYVHVNPAFEREFNVSASEFIGDDGGKLFGPEDMAQMNVNDEKVLAGNVVQVEHSEVFDGRILTSHIVLVPMRDKSGKVVGICGISSDITERKLNEEALRREKENLANVLEAMEDGVYIVDDRYRIQYSTSRWKENSDRLKTDLAMSIFTARPALVKAAKCLQRSIESLCASNGALPVTVGRTTKSTRFCKTKTAPFQNWPS